MVGQAGSKTACKKPRLLQAGICGIGPSQSQPSGHCVQGGAFIKMTRLIRTGQLTMLSVTTLSFDI